MRSLVVTVLFVTGCSTMVTTGSGGGGAGGGGAYDAGATGGGSASGGGAGTGGGIEGAGGGAATGGGSATGGGTQDAGLIACPTDGGVDGYGVCGAWQLSAWDTACTDGYTRTRTCTAGYDCRVTDHNGCAAGLNAGSAPPQGCPACPGGPGYLQYFGYWRDSDIHNFVCQIQDHVNYSMTGDSQSEVDLAASYGVPNFGLLAPTSGSPAPLNVQVVRDDADVGAWGWCANNPCPNGIQDGWAAVKMQIESDGAAIKAAHPNAHLMINLGDGNADGKLDFQGIPGFTLPNGVDWVGLECYTGAANCHANAVLVEPLLPPGGKIWVIMNGVGTLFTEASLVQDAQDNFNWSSQDPNAIGLIGFVWANAILCPPDCTSLAVKEMPDLLAKYRALGQIITGKVGVNPIPDDICPPQ
jgi:hypothetical protein